MINENNIGDIYFNLGIYFMNKDYKRALEYFEIADKEYYVNDCKQYLCDLMIKQKRWKSSKILFRDMLLEYISDKKLHNKDYELKYLFYAFLCEFADKLENNKNNFNKIIAFYTEINPQIDKIYKIKHLISSTNMANLSNYLNYLHINNLADDTIENLLEEIKQSSL